MSGLELQAVMDKIADIDKLRQDSATTDLKRVTIPQAEVVSTMHHQTMVKMRRTARIHPQIRTKRPRESCRSEQVTVLDHNLWVSHRTQRSVCVGQEDLTYNHDRLNLGILLTALEFNIVATAVPIIS